MYGPRKLNNLWKPKPRFVKFRVLHPPCHDYVHGGFFPSLTHSLSPTCTLYIVHIYKTHTYAHTNTHTRTLTNIHVYTPSVTSEYLIVHIHMWTFWKLIMNAGLGHFNRIQYSKRRTETVIIINYRAYSRIISHRIINAMLF